MGRRKRVVADHDIYAIVNQDEQIVYVWHTRCGNGYSAYKEHVRYRKCETKDYFQRCAEKNTYPPMYLLTTVTATPQGAFKYVVAWTRYFMDHDWTSLSYPKIQAYAKDLLPETEDIYNAIKELDFKDVLIDSSILVRSYKRRDSNKIQTPKNEIKMSVSHEEYERIRSAAADQNMSMSKYCRKMTLNGKIYNVEGPLLYEFTNEVREAKIILKQILYGIHQRCNYYPADLENIEKLSDRICTAEQDLRKAYSENTKILIRLLRR